MKTFFSKSAAAAICILSVVPSFCVAQAKPKILVNPPSGEFAWSVKFDYDQSFEKIAEEAKGDLAAKSLELSDLSRPKKASYVIKKLVSKRTVSMEGGTKLEAFQWENFEFQKSPAHEEVMMSDLKNYPSVDQLFRKTFPGVHWVTPELFVEVQKAYGQECAYFRDGTPAKPDAEKMDAVLDASKYEIREAWFSLQTGLPIAFKAGPLKGEFTFEKPPSGALSLPADVRESMKKMADYQNYLKSRAELGQQTTTP